MHDIECKDASCASLGPCLMVDSKEAAMTSEEHCANNLALWGLIQSADNREIRSTPTTATADQNAEDHHEDNRFKFKRILCCFNNNR